MSEIVQRARRAAPNILASFFAVLWISPTASQEAVSLGGKKIVGGVATTIAKHPWQVALIVTRPDGSFLCGGSVIAGRWILTAAHCFGSSAANVKVKAKTGATDYVSEGVWIDVDKIIIHESYDPKSKAHDIALLRLPSSSAATIIPLAASETKVELGEMLTVTGWGVTETGDKSPVLKKATVPYVDNDTCNDPKSYKGRVLGMMMCAGAREGGIDACQGDSGGPLVKGEKPEDAILVGIVSFGEGCAQQLKYGVYTRVSEERDWILGSIAKQESKS